MVKTRKAVEGDGISASKATWDDELTLTFCELCVKEVDAGNRPTTHLNGRGWENVVALFEEKARKNYGKPQLKNKWDTLKKEWRLWRELLKNTTGLEWCPVKNTVDASKDWWDDKVKENTDFKRFKKRGIEPRLNELMGHMFGDTVTSGEHALAPSSGILPCAASTGDATPNEGFGDSEEHETENEDIPDIEIDVNASPEISSKDKRMLGVVQDKGKKLTPIRISTTKTLTTPIPIEKLRDSMTTQRNLVDVTVLPCSQYTISDAMDSMTTQRNLVDVTVLPCSRYTISDAMDALRSLESEVPKKHFLYFFATKIFQVPVKREMFLNLDPDVRSWWLQCEYDEQNLNARASSLVATPPQGFQPFHLFHSRSR